MKLNNLTVLAIGFLMSFSVLGQSDEFYFYSDGTLSMNPISITGIEDQGEGISTTIDNKIVLKEPEYRKTEVKSLTLSILGHVGINVPVYQTRDWSVGAKINVGAGWQFAVKNSEGLKGFTLSFPQFAYYRRVGNSFDYSVLAGYKFTRAPLNYHHFLLGFELNLDDDRSVRLYGSPFRYKYYREYTNGEIEPMIEVAEFGISYVVKF